MGAKQERVMENNWGAWVWVKWKPGAPSDAWDEWQSLKDIEGAWSTPGEWDCALWINLDNPDDIESLVWEKIRGNKWVESTETKWAKKWW